MLHLSLTSRTVELAVNFLKYWTFFNQALIDQELRKTKLCSLPDPELD